MVTKRTRLMSAFAAILMLVSMFTAFVLPVSAADYSNEANGYPNFPNASDYASYPSQNHFLVKTLADLTAVQGAASSFAGKWIHLAASIDFSAAANQSMGAQTVNIDGHNYAIRGINLDAGSASTKGWFTTYAGTIQNLVVENATVRNTINMGSVLIAQLSGATTLNNVMLRNCTLSNSTANTTNASINNNDNALVVARTEGHTLTINNIALIGCTFNKVGSPWALNNTGFLIGCAKGHLTVNGALMVGNTHSLVKAKVATDGSYKDDGGSGGNAANGLLIGVHEADGMNVNISNVAVFGTVDATSEEGTTMNIDTFVMDRTKFQGKVNIAVTDENKAAFYTNSDKTTWALPEDVAATNIYSLSDKWLVDDDTKGDDLDINGTAYTLEQIMSADTVAALNTAAGSNTWKTSTVWKDANGAGYPVPTAIEDMYNAHLAATAKETPEYLRAVYVREYYEPYKEGYAAEFDLWEEGAAMKAAYDAAVAYIADPNAPNAATAYETMQANFKEFAEANGTVNLHLKNEYPYYPRLVDAAAYGSALLAKYNAALNSNSGYDAVKTNPAADPRLDDDGHLNFRIGSAEEWISLVKNPANVNGYSLLANGAGSDDTVISGDGDCRVVFSLTNDIVFTTDGNTATDLSTLSNPTLVPTNTNFVFDGHNHVFKNVNMNINTTGWNGGDRGLFYTGMNNVIYKNFGVASGTINVTGTATGGRLRISPLVAGTEGSLATMVNCWNAADVNVTATGFTSIYAAAIGNLARGNNNFVNCLNLGTITISDEAKATAGTAVYNAMATYNRTDYATQEYDNYSLFNCSSIADGVASLVAGGQNKNGPDSASKFFDADATMGEIAYHMNANFHETAGILNNANNTTSHAAYSRLNLIRPYYTLVDGSVAYGTEATAVRKLTASLVDSNGDETSTKEYYYNGDLTVDAPAIEGYTPAAATVAMNAQDQTLVYNPEAGTVDLTNVNAIFAEWKKYDLKYFTEDSANAIEAVLDDAEALINETVTPTEQLVSELITAEAALDPKLNYTYPTYVPVDEYATYEKFGLHDASGIIYLAIDDAAALKFARDNAKFVNGVAGSGGFLSTVTNGAGTTYANTSYGNGSADAASKSDGDGKYRVRFVLTDDIDMTGYTFTGYSQWNANTAFLGYNHVISNVKMELSGSGAFFAGHNGYIADVGVQGSITTTDAAASIAPLSGFGGGNGHLRNCWFDIDLTGGAKRSAIASGANVPASNIVNVASFGTGANYVFETTTTTCGVKGIYYPDGVAFTSSGGAESGTTKLTATAGESGELAYLLNNADYSSNNAALGTYYYGDDYATKLATYYDVVDEKFAFSATNPEYCRIELINTAGNKTLYAKKNTTITLNYAEGLECEYTVISGTSTLSGVNNDQLLVLEDTSITVTLTGIVTDALEAAVAKYNGLNVGYFVNKTSGENDLANQIAAANAIIDGTNEDAEQDDVNALATLIADGYQLDDYPNIPKVSEFDTYKDLGAVNFLVTDITELNALAGKKASFTKDYTVHFAENVVIVVGAEDAAKNMSGMNANIDGHGATIKGVTFSLTSGAGDAAWLGVYGGSKISNLVLDSWNTTFTGWKSGVLIANSSVALTLENITIKNCTASYVGNYGGFLLADYNGSALTLTNITVEGSTMTHAAGNDGLLVGRVNTGTFTATGIYAKGNTVNHNNPNVSSGNGLIFGEICVNSTISNVIAVGNTMTFGREQSKAGGIVGNIKNGAITLSNAIIEDTGIGIVFRQWTDNNAHAPSFIINNVYTDAAKIVSYSTFENLFSGTDVTGATATAEQIANGYATNALNLAGDDIWTMVGNAVDGYEPAFITGSEKATVAVSFTSDSWLAKQVAGDSGLTYTYYTDSTGKLIGVAEADVVALNKVDNWNDLNAAVLATYDAAITIPGTYAGEEHIHSFATLTPNDDGVTHTGEDCTVENCPWYDEAIECTPSEYVHNDVNTYEGSMHTAKCACDRTMGEAEACKASATEVPGTEEPASCTEPGSKTYLCGKCYQNIVEEIPALGHDYDGVEWETDSNNEGWHIRECARDCGDSQREECNYVEDEARREEPANGENGTRYLVCAECGHEKTEVILAPTSLKLTAPSTAYAGKSVKVKVELMSNPGLYSLNVTFGYDANIYALDEESVISHIEATGVDITIQDISDITVENGITWRTVAVATSGLWTDTDIMTVTFNVLDEAATGSTTIYTRVDEDEGAIGEGDENFKVEGAEVEIDVSDIILGDFNKTGDLNMIDVVAMLRYHVYGSTVFNDFEQNYDLEAFDYNEDGDADLNDVIAVMKYVNQKLNDKQAGK